MLHTHENEQARLQALASYQIMDTPAEEQFDASTRLISELCDTPIALASFVDGERQWFKSRVGLDVQQTPREISFCTHAIQDANLFVVHDALDDQRFVSNPLVTGDPKIRFYAGMPLTTGDGFRLGTLCVIDRKPRTLTPLQQQALEVLGDNLAVILDARRMALLLELEPGVHMATTCAWCSKVRTELDRKAPWVSAEEFITDRYYVSHGMCPSCAEAFS